MAATTFSPCTATTTVPIWDDAKLERCKEFVRQNTMHFDASHDYAHALQVYHHALHIVKEMNVDYEKDILACVALLHDVCDHKYEDQSCSRDVLAQFVRYEMMDGNEQRAMRVLNIIDNLSYSKERKGLRKDLHQDNLYLHIVGDADRLEALGPMGIARCTTYTASRGGKIPEDVILHCKEKLLLLLPNGYIKTEPGRRMAQPLHQHIVDYVADYEKQVHHKSNHS